MVGINRSGRLRQGVWEGQMSCVPLQFVRAKSFSHPPNYCQVSPTYSGNLLYIYWSCDSSILTDNNGLEYNFGVAKAIKSRQRYHRLRSRPSWHMYQK